MKTVPPIYFVQVASLGGSKLGWADQPEGGWVTHDVFLDRADAEKRAAEYETVPRFDSDHRDISAEVVTAARVVSLDDLAKQLPPEKLNRELMAFQTRINELLDRRAE